MEEVGADPPGSDRARVKVVISWHREFFYLRKLKTEKSGKRNELETSVTDHVGKTGGSEYHQNQMRERQVSNVSHFTV